jgi:hypothetical protein
MRNVCFALTGVIAIGAANAASLKLSYTKTVVGALYQYDMTLSVDTSASAWTPGMGWGWLIFGDVANNTTSPLAGFQMITTFPVGPWTSLSSSSGGHNGPTFAPVGNQWIPTAASDTLFWSGTHSFNAPDNTLTFSTLSVGGGATAPSFKIMTTNPVPEPISMISLASGAAMLLRRRRNR